MCVSSLLKKLKQRDKEIQLLAADNLNYEIAIAYWLVMSLLIKYQPISQLFIPKKSIRESLLGPREAALYLAADNSSLKKRYDKLLCIHKRSLFSS